MSAQVCVQRRKTARLRYPLWSDGGFAVLPESARIAELRSRFDARPIAPRTTARALKN